MRVHTYEALFQEITDAIMEKLREEGELRDSIELIEKGNSRESIELSKYQVEN